MVPLDQTRGLPMSAKEHVHVGKDPGVAHIPAQVWFSLRPLTSLLVGLWTHPALLYCHTFQKKLAAAGET